MVVPRGDWPTPNPQRPRAMVFSKRISSPPPTAEQSSRQGDVVRSAWRHFGEPGPVIAFLNTQHDTLEGQPLHLAMESDSGLKRVQAWLEQDSRKAQFERPVVEEIGYAGRT